MSARPVRLAVAVVVAVCATWFVARTASSTATPPVLWRAPIVEGPWDLAADVRGVVVTTSQQAVYGLSRAGREEWRTEVPALVLGQPGIGADVAVVGQERAVTALDRRDGRIRWSVPMAGPVHSVRVADAVTLAGDETGALTALATATGDVRWKVRFSGMPWSAARIDRDAGVALVSWHGGESPAVRAFDLATGALRWTAPTARASGAPTVAGGLALLAIGDDLRHARIEARDITTGVVRWQTAVPASFEEAIEPAADATSVVAVDHFGVVTHLDLATGALRWQHDLADVLLETRVALTRTRIAFTSYAGILHVLDRRTGREVARLGPKRLGGLAVDSLLAPWRPGKRLLVSLRLRDWGVHLRSLP